MKAKGFHERRTSPRSTHADFGWLVAARLRPGRDVRLLDLSSGGALVEARVRLMPGTGVVLHLVGCDSHHTIHGTVLRCRVSALDQESGVRYRAALGFHRHFRIPHCAVPEDSEVRHAAVG